MQDVISTDGCPVRVAKFGLQGCFVGVGSAHC